MNPVDAPVLVSGYGIHILRAKESGGNKMMQYHIYRFFCSFNLYEV